MKLFGTDGIRGKVNHEPMTPETILKLGSAFARFLKNHKDNGRAPRVVIGKDTRLSGYIFETALTSGLCSHGVDVFLVGPMPTPAIAHITKSFAADGGIVISASHNPSGDNGIKFFDRHGLKLENDVEEEIEQNIIDNVGSEDGTQLGKAYRIEDARGRYIEFIKSTVRNTSLKGMKVVLDCANGAAYKVAPLILKELGAELIVIADEPDGHNINKDCGSLYAERVADMVVKNNADCGIALDGDADRVILADETGSVLDGDHILAISAKHLDDHGCESTCIKNVVATVMSNIGLEEFMKKEGLELVRTDVGDKNVTREMIRLKARLGGEQSGHIIFGDYSKTGDGTLTALQILNIMKKTGKKLSELKGYIKKYPQILINFKVSEKKPIEDMGSVCRLIEDCQKRLGDSSRILVRYSGTEMVCRVMVEGSDEEMIREFAEEVAGAIKLSFEKRNHNG
ncbi:phosphoglucosamine mutase [Candidatus Woesearchaeota archaeon]|nr:phosphoglucosamine mutase [Candidatus Woesearchaeota archaeon]